MNIGGRPLTLITDQMIDTARAIGGVIVARWSPCGRYITYQAMTTDAAALVDTRCAVIVADRDDTTNLSRRELAELAREKAIETLAPAHPRV